MALGLRSAEPNTRAKTETEAEAVSASSTTRMYDSYGVHWREYTRVHSYTTSSLDDMAD